MTQSELLREQCGNKIPTQITVAELSLMLKKIDGASASMFSMVTATMPTMNKGKKNDGTMGVNPYDKERVRKVSKYIAMLNFNYTNAVNNQLQREGKEANFQASTNWHEKKFDQYNGCVSQKEGDNSGQEYLAFGYKLDNVKRIAFTVDGTVASNEESEIIKSFIPKQSSPKNQGTDEAILYQTIRLQNIKLIQLKGEFYEIVN